jgi:ArsR family transcriptional regulator, arsenate/arsenite/antimonite-responsive transcriptional repressor
MGSAWKAVADDSRRQVLVLLKDGEKTPSEIATHFEFTFPALSTHLRVLRDAGLVKERKEGQRKLYSVNRDGMAEMVEFLDMFWDEKLHSLKRYAESKSKKRVRGRKIWKLRKK